MSYLAQIVHDARPRRAAAPLTAVGGARSTEAPLVDARLLSSNPDVQSSVPDPEEIGAEPRSLVQNALPEADTANVDPSQPRAVVRPGDARNAAFDTGKGLSVEGFTPHMPVADEAPFPVAGSERVSFASALSDKPGRSRNNESAPLDISLRTPSPAGEGGDPDERLQTRELQKETGRPFPETRRLEGIARPAALQGPSMPEKAEEGHLTGLNSVPLSQPTARPWADRALPRDPVQAPDTAAERTATTEVRIGHLQIDIADGPQPPRPAPSAPSRATPVAARFHVRRL